MKIEPNYGYKELNPKTSDFTINDSLAEFITSPLKLETPKANIFEKTRKYFWLIFSIFAGLSIYLINPFNLFKKSKKYRK